MRALSVDLAERSYPVLVGPGARHEVGRFLPPSAKSAVIVTQEGIKEAGWVDGLDPGVPSEVFIMPDGEDAKTLATVEMLTRRFANAGLCGPMSSSPWAAASSPTLPGSPPRPITAARRT